MGPNRDQSNLQPGFIFSAVALWEHSPFWPVCVCVLRLAAHGVNNVNLQTEIKMAKAAMCFFI